MKRTVTIFICDNPNCDKIVEQNGKTPNIPKSGFYGKIVNAGVNPDKQLGWFACRESHVNASIKSILSKLSSNKSIVMDISDNLLKEASNP